MHNVSYLVVSISNELILVLILQFILYQICLFLFHFLLTSVTLTISLTLRDDSLVLNQATVFFFLLLHNYTACIDEIKLYNNLVILDVLRICKSPPSSLLNLITQNWLCFMWFCFSSKHEHQISTLLRNKHFWH